MTLFFITHTHQSTRQVVYRTYVSNFTEALMKRKKEQQRKSVETIDLRGQIISLRSIAATLFRQSLTSLLGVEDFI